MLGVIEDSRNEFKIKLPDDLVWLSLTIWMLVFFCYIFNIYPIIDFIVITNF